MNKEELSIFADIKGVGAASGLFLKEDLLYVIGDNSAYLYEYNIVSKYLNKIQILNNSGNLQNIEKAKKPDFEVLCNVKNLLYIFGSGSKPNRNLLVVYNFETTAIIQHDLTDLYAEIKRQVAIDNDNFNIEGAVFTGNDWLLFNRGNGNAAKNGIIKLSGKDLKKPKQITFTPIVLQKQNHVVASFTDAVLHEKEIYFIAAAEDTTSTFNDGEILGSYIGSINVDTLQLNFTKQIATNQKFEGITFSLQNGNYLEFLLCEDRDNDVLETVIYKFLI
jgi:hypothetical protein